MHPAWEEVAWDDDCGQSFAEVFLGDGTHLCRILSTGPTMGIRAIEWALSQTLPVILQLVLLRMSAAVDDSAKEWAFPGRLTELARRCHLEPEELNVVLEELRHCGLITHKDGSTDWVILGNRPSQIR